jgi:hypothetical protein
MALFPTSAIPSGATSSYSIDNSLRFNDDDPAYLSWTPSSSGSLTTWTWSAWIKRGSTTTAQYLFNAYNGTSYTIVNISAVGGLQTLGQLGYHMITNARYRDPSAWYHVVYVYDTTNGTAEDRDRLYVNGERVTDWYSRVTQPSSQVSVLNSNTTMRLGTSDITLGTVNFDGYLSEVNFVDGQALAPTDFGEFDADYGHWKPIAYAGTYGTNGFYLDFKDSSALGNDVSGNNNDWTPTNLVATDQMLDSPTSNFATLSSIDKSSLATLSEGTLKAVIGSGAGKARSGFGVTSGKWYCEAMGGWGATNGTGFGFTNNSYRPSTDGDIGASTTGNGFYCRLGDDSQGNRYFQYKGVTANIGDVFNNDIIGLAVDFDTGLITYYKNNVSFYSVTKSDIVGQEWMVTVSNESGGTTKTVYLNFGQDSSFAGNKTAQNNGEDGDDFYYTPPTDYKSLKASNLPDPTVIPGEHFNVVTWTGNTTDSTTTNTITGVGFEPSFVWTKVRSHTDNHRLLDQVRGGTKKLASNTTNAELTRDYGKISTWGSDGFTVTGADGYEMNYNNSTYVSWCWKANGAGVSNTNGSLTSTVSADVDAGFSIVSYTGDNTYPPKTVAHGLSKSPEMIIVKNRDTTNYWYAYHHKLDSTAPEDKYIFFNYTDAVLDATVWGDTAPTSSVFTVYSNSGVAGNGDAMLAYAFHSVPGYSKVGSYVGNGSSTYDGTFVQCGFKPKFVMMKRVNSSANWWLFDSERRPFNVNSSIIVPNISNTEYDYNVYACQCYGIDLLSNGFKVRTSVADINYNGHTYIFLAFAETPFKYSNGA